MNKLNKLIKELCPNGVEYKTIQELCEITRGKVISKDFIRYNIGEYPVYSSQTENNGELGKINTYDFNGEYLTWTTDGANAGSVFYRNGKFSITNVCGLLKTLNNKITTKFLFYILSIEAPKYVNTGMGNPKLMSNVMAKIRVAVPPLEVQDEIVRILDDFTLLSAELSAELKARKEQYEYYRDKLLKNNKNKVEIKTLDDVCNISAGGDVPKENFSKEKNEKYNIPIISNGIGKNALYGYTDIVKIDKKAVTIAARGTIGYAEYRDYSYYPIIRLISAVSKNENELNTKFLYYSLQGRKYNVQTTGIPQLTVPTFKKEKISIPEIKIQEKIVEVLDNFNKICSDLKIGLPAEIEARQKQYEFYRDTLLTYVATGEIILQDKTRQDKTRQDKTSNN